MFDLAIVGAGVIGATAFYLAGQEKPNWRILLLDRSLVGKGASAYSAGLDFPYGRTPWQKQLSMRSESMYAEFKERIPGLPVHPLHFVGVAKKQDLDQIISRFTAKSVHIANSSEREAVLSRLPGFRIDHGQELLVGACGAIGFVDRLVSFLVAEACASPGRQCWEGSAITQIQPMANGGYTLTAVDGRRIQAHRVLISTGPWLLEGPGNAGAKAAGVRIKKVAALHVLREPPPDCPVLYFFDEDAFLLPVLESGKWIFSFTSREWDCTPDSGNLHIRPEERAAALAILERYYPSLLPDCSGGRVFCDAYCPDWAPLVSSTEKNLVIAGACSGAGFRIAPAVAEKALQLFPGYVNAGEV